MKKWIPNALTLANLGCGFIALIFIFGGEFAIAAGLVGAALLLDFLDGFTARLLNVHSELGKQLDSLADMVTFGVVPGFLMFELISLSPGPETVSGLPYIAILIPLFSALRLARFNLDARQSSYFIGLPTPANAILIFTIALVASYGENEILRNVLLHPFFLVAVSVGASLLLIAELPLWSLKVKSMSWKENKGRIIFILAVILLLVIFRFQAIVFIIPLYLLISLIIKPDR